MTGLLPEALLEALPVALLVLDAEGCISFINPVAEEMLEKSAKAALGKLLKEERGCEIFANLATQAIRQKALLTEYGAQLQGYSDNLKVQAIPLYGNNAGAAMLCFERQDHAEALQAEEIKQRIARASSLMAAMLAHEIKNPLSGIRGAAQLLGEKEGEDAHLSGLICREVDRIRDQVEKMEALTEACNVALSPLNIHEVLRYVCHAAKAGIAANITLVEEFDPSLPEVTGNETALVQLFLNLLKNAAEALVETTNPHILIKTQATGAASARLLKSGGAKSFITVEVADNGPGVPKEVEDTLFEPFVTTRGRGRGLGLAIAAKLAGDMEGHIEHIHTSNGTVFRVNLPVAGSPVARS